MTEAYTTGVSEAYKPWRNLTCSDKGGTAIIGVGDCMVEECLAASEMLAETTFEPNDIFSLNELSLLERQDDDDLKAFKAVLSRYHTNIWVYNGYPRLMKALLWSWPKTNIEILGFQDRGRTSAGVERLAENGVDRFSVANAIRKAIQ